MSVQDVIKKSVLESGVFDKFDVPVPQVYVLHRRAVHRLEPVLDRVVKFFSHCLSILS